MKLLELRKIINWRGPELHFGCIHLLNTRKYCDNTHKYYGNTHQYSRVLSQYL